MFLRHDVTFITLSNFLLHLRLYTTSKLSGLLSATNTFNTFLNRQKVWFPWRYSHCRLLRLHTSSTSSSPTTHDPITTSGATTLIWTGCFSSLSVLPEWKRKNKNTCSCSRWGEWTDQVGRVHCPLINFTFSLIALPFVFCFGLVITLFFCQQARDYVILPH